MASSTTRLFLSKISSRCQSALQSKRRLLPKPSSSKAKQKLIESLPSAPSSVRLLGHKLSRSLSTFVNGTDGNEYDDNHHYNRGSNPATNSGCSPQCDVYDNDDTATQHRSIIINPAVDDDEPEEMVVSFYPVDSTNALFSEAHDNNDVMTSYHDGYDNDDRDETSTFSDPGQRIDASEMADAIREDVRSFTCQLSKDDLDQPTLAAITLSTNITNPSSNSIASLLSQNCQRDGVNFKLFGLTNRDEAEPLLRHLNEDPSINGVMINYPIYNNHSHNQRPQYSLDKFCPLTGTYLSQDDYLRDAILPSCDVEGLHHYNAGAPRNSTMMTSSVLSFWDRQRSDDDHNVHPNILPCWVQAVKTIWEEDQRYCMEDDHCLFEDVIVTIVGGSAASSSSMETVVDPLLSYLTHEGATVNYCVCADTADDDKTLIYRCTSDGIVSETTTTAMDMENCINQSDLVITGLPDSTISTSIPTEWIQPGTMVMNLSSTSLSGGVEFEENILSIPGVRFVSNVNTLVVALLEQNLVKLYKTYGAARNKFMTNDDCDAGATRSGDSHWVRDHPSMRQGLQRGYSWDNKRFIIPSTFTF